MAQQFNAVGLGHRRHQPRRRPYTGNGDDRFWRSPAPESNSSAPIVVHCWWHRPCLLTGIILSGSGNDDRVVRRASGLRRADSLQGIACQERLRFIEHARSPQQPELVGKPGLLVTRVWRRRCGRRWRQRHGHSSGSGTGARDDHVHDREDGASGSNTRTFCTAACVKAAEQRWWEWLRRRRRQQRCASGSGCSRACGCASSCGAATGRGRANRRPGPGTGPAACGRRRAAIQPRRVTIGISNAGTNDDAPARDGHRGSL
jgi:hypothetical protein